MKLSLVPGAVQVRLCAAKASGYNRDSVKSWSVPAWILPMVSTNLVDALGGETTHPTILHSRIAKAMGIENGDLVEVEFVEIGERCRLPVVVMNSIPTALLIHGALKAGLIESSSAEADGETLFFSSGKMLKTSMQSFWAGLRMEPPRTSQAILEFHGNDSGYGFCLRLANKFGQIDKTENSLLLQGYGYSPNNDGSTKDVSYKGLLDGLWWALRCHVHTLWIRGDSAVVVNQVHGTCDVKDPMLQESHDQVLALLEQAEKKGITCIVENVDCHENLLADSLAELGSNLQECAVAVKWANCNRLYR